MSPRVSDILTDRLIALGFMGETDQIIRTHRGPWGKADGRWAWYIVDHQGCERGIGSGDTMTECARADKLVIGEKTRWGDQEITAESEEEQWMRNGKRSNEV